ncbi:MAG: hypothetical protein C5B57_09550 [Blastocatellia bacterium]|nr:MAG: hypothetical protein C5B57_09550 [Blastocatellia bacterium]
MLFGFLLAPPGPAHAEDHGHFFFFIAPATATSATRDVVPRVGVPTHTTLVHAGGGGEGALGTRWGAGTDLGGLARARGKDTVASLSVNGFYHPLGQHRGHVDPYGVFGYGLLLGDSGRQALGAPHVGSGLTYWLPERRGYEFGLKLEFRSAFRGGPENLRYREVRIGVGLWR